MQMSCGLSMRAKIVKEWTARIWVQEEDDLLDQIFRSTTTATGPISSLDPSMFHPRDIVASLKSLLQCKPDVEYLILEEAGDWVITTFVAHVSEHPLHKPFSFDGSMLFKFDGDSICEIHTQINYFALFEGLGQLPEDSLPVCLTGASLTWR